MSDYFIIFHIDLINLYDVIVIVGLAAMLMANLCMYVHRGILSAAITCNFVDPTSTIF